MSKENYIAQVIDDDDDGDGDDDDESSNFVSTFQINKISFSFSAMVIRIERQNKLNV